MERPGKGSMNRLSDGAVESAQPADFDLQRLSEIVASAGSSAFSDANLLSLAELLGTEIVVVSRRDKQTPGLYQTLVVAIDGRILPNFRYSAIDTPCGELLKRGNCIIPAGVQQQFPKDVFLREREVESYAGVRLSDSTGQHFGHIAVMGRKPLRDIVNTESALSLFAVPIAAEIERQRLMQCYTDLFELSRDAIILTNRQGIIVQANRETENLFGWSREELIGQPVEMLLPAPSRELHVRLRELYMQASVARSMGGDRNDLQGLRRDGTVFSVDITLSPMETEDGLLIASTVRDVTERHQIQAALHAAKAFSETLIENVAGLFYVLDQSGMFVRWNKAMEELYSLTAAEMRQTNALSRVHEDDRQLIADKMMEVFNSGYATAEARLLTTNGIIHATLNGRRIEIDGTVYLVGSGIDITERIQMNDLLRRSEARYRELFESSRDAITILSLKTGHFISANAATLRMYGVQSQEEFSRLTPWMLSPKFQPDGRLSAEAAHEMIERAEREGSLFFEWTHQRVNGDPFPATILLNKITVEGVPMLQATVRDISQEKAVLRKLEATARELSAANAMIEQDRASLAVRVAERTAELSAANAELAKVSQAKSEFLATMSHELRTPLNGLLGMNELLLATDLSNRQRQFVEASQFSGKLLLQLINDILDFSKIEAGKLELDLRECDFEELIGDTTDCMAHAARLKGLELSCQLDPDACVVGLCDDRRIRQILINLVGNALKFTDAGSVVIHAQLASPREGRTRLRFSVTDTGVGIPPEQQNRLFKVFSQVDSSTTRRFGGTGLGLSICRQIVELMKGEIGVESQAGKGSQFWFEIPVDAVGDSTEPPGVSGIDEGTSVLFLVRADRPRQRIRQCLEILGCRIVQTTTVETAIELVTSANGGPEPFQLVIADHRCAAGDQYSRLQELSGIEGLRVILMGTPPDHHVRFPHTGQQPWLILSDPVPSAGLASAIKSELLAAQTAGTREPDGTAPLDAVVRPVTTSIRPTGHILVAEDNRINQMYISELLKLLGHTCHVVDNGREVLTALETNHYDLILMDCQMPEMDGFVASREIRKRESSGKLPGHLPVIALTANAIKGDRERCLDAGMDDYLSKPVEAEHLRAKLEEVLLNRANS